MRQVLIALGLCVFALPAMAAARGVVPGGHGGGGGGGSGAAETPVPPPPPPSMAEPSPDLATDEPSTTTSALPPTPSPEDREDLKRAIEASDAARARTPRL